MAINDDYLNCKLYEGQELDPAHKNFSLFEDAKTGKFYFAYLSIDGKVFLRSEGYADATSRQKGIDSIEKNISIEKRFAIIEEGGKYFIILKAGNHKEIGRSCDFKTQAVAEKSLSGLFAKSVPSTSEKPKARKSEAKSKIKQVTVEQSKTVAADIEVSDPKDLEFVTENLSNFLEINEYLNRPRIWDSYGITGYVKFQANDGLHYFGVYNPDGSLYLRSIGFKNPEDRDATFDIMDSTILLEENYKIENHNGRYYAVLFDGLDIIALSPDFSSFIEAFVTTPGGRPREVQGTMF